MKRLFMLVMVLASVCSMAAEVRMPRIFSDNMLLQREQPIRIWGWAAKDETVQICFCGIEAAAGDPARDGNQLVLTFYTHGNRFGLLASLFRTED